MTSTTTRGHDHGHGGHGHDHGHGGHDHAHDLRGASKKSLILALALIGGFMFVEVVGGVLSGSLALLADAAHMLTDAASILLALVAMWIANRPAAAGSTFGFYRTEVLAALLNTLSLWLIAGWIFFEAYHRFFDTPEVEGPLLLGVGVIGLVVNIAAAWVLHRAAGESLNVEGAFQHVLADLMGSVGVIISGILILSFAESNSTWYIVDPIMSVLIGLLILKVSWGLFMRVFKVLLEGTPDSVDLYYICSEMEEVEGVTLVHDVHAWTITSGYDAFTAHVFVSPTQARTTGGNPESIAKDRVQARSQPRDPAGGVVCCGLRGEPPRGAPAGPNAGPGLTRSRPSFSRRSREKQNGPAGMPRRAALLFSWLLLQGFSKPTLKSGGQRKHDSPVVNNRSEVPELVWYFRGANPCNDTKKPDYFL